LVLIDVSSEREGKRKTKAKGKGHSGSFGLGDIWNLLIFEAFERIATMVIFSCAFIKEITDTDTGERARSRVSILGQSIL